MMHTINPLHLNITLINIKYYYKTQRIHALEIVKIHCKSLYFDLFLCQTMSPSKTTGAVIFYTTCFLCIIIITPWLIYYTFKFNQYKNTIVVRKRYPNIIIVILLLSILNICIRIPLTVLISTPTNLPWLNSIHHSNLLVIIEAFLNVFLTHAVITLIALRFWMIFYKINYTYSSSTSGVCLSLHTFHI